MGGHSYVTELRQKKCSKYRRVLEDNCNELLPFKQFNLACLVLYYRVLSQHSLECFSGDCHLTESIDSISRSAMAVTCDPGSENPLD